MDDFQRDLENRLRNQEFRDHYQELEMEYTFMQALIDLRKKKKITQKQLADLTGIHQADISKLESGATNPTLKLMQRIADGLDMKILFVFEPKASLTK